jgi:redox-sensitive bicupin YhaK (pirin superfamily)
MEQDIKVRSKSDDTAFVLLAGQPINEPMARSGPFVLNTEEELNKAFYDY